MPFMEQGDFRLYYEDSGGDKPAILFLHGAGGNHVIWWQQVPAFVDTYRCITVDQRSFGQSLDGPNGPGCTALAGDALALMDYLQLDRAALVSQSMGGWAAAEIAAMTSERIAKLVLVDAVGIKPGGRDDRDIADIFALGPQDLVKAMWHDPANAPNPADMSDEQLQVMIANRTALAMYTWDPYMHNPRLKHRLHRIDVPTLLIEHPPRPD